MTLIQSASIPTLRFNTLGLHLPRVQVRLILGLLVLAQTYTLQAEGITREEWFTDLLKGVSGEICSVAEFKKCHELTEDRCSGIVQSVMLKCFESNVENIPQTIKDAATARAQATTLGQCFEPEFADETRHYRRDIPACQISEESDESPTEANDSPDVEAKEEEPIETTD